MSVLLYVQDTCGTSPVVGLYRLKHLVRFVLFLEGSLSLLAFSYRCYEIKTDLNV